MDRRLAGALLVVAACAAAAIAPVLAGVRVPGTAQAIFLPADPQVGDCVIELGPDEAGMGTLDRETSASSGASVITATDVDAPVVMGPCTSPTVIGEVAGVGTVSDADRAHRQAGRPADLDCRAAALEYAGLVPVDDRFEMPHTTVDQPMVSDPVTWNLSFNVLDRWAMPSSLLNAAGKTWAACVVSARGGAYTGRLANAYSGGRLPAAFGTCRDGRDVGAASAPVDCGRPHLAEVISMGLVVDRSTTNLDEVRRSCLALAAKVMHRDDPTDSGRLSIEVSPNSLGSALRTISSINIVCSAVPAGRPVVGSLVGWGEQPIHYAN